MITSVSNSAQFQNIDNKPVVAVKPQAKLLPSDSLTTDSVKLSAKAEAAALQQRGYTVGEIASNLDVTSQTIDSYLRLNTTPSTSAASAHTTTSQSNSATKAASTNSVAAPLKAEAASNGSSSNSSSNPSSKTTETDATKAIYKPASEAFQQLAHS